MTAPMMAESYGCAIAAGRSAAPVVGAAGMSAVRLPLGPLLWRAKYSLDRAVFPELRARLMADVVHHAVRRHWPRPERVMARQLACRVLDWWVFGVCATCTGRRYQKMPGAPGLSARACQVCDGTGRRALVGLVPPDLLKRAEEIASILDVVDGVMHAEMSRKMRVSPGEYRERAEEARALRLAHLAAEAQRREAIGQTDCAPHGRGLP